MRAPELELDGLNRITRAPSATIIIRMINFLFQPNNYYNKKGLDVDLDFVIRHHTIGHVRIVQLYKNIFYLL